MSSQHFNHGGSDGFSGDMRFFPSAPVPSSLVLGSQAPPLSNTTGVEGRKPEMGFQILNPSMFQQQECRVTKRTNDEGDEYFGVENKSLSLKPGEEVEEAKRSASGKVGHVKLCARGHWRPAEDAKLKELVTQYGPQNWNLIAEHLEGRSGNPLISMKIYICG